MSASRSARRVGSRCSMGGRPAPARRTRPRASRSPVRTSAIPRSTVVRARPVAGRPPPPRPGRWPAPRTRPSADGPAHRAAGSPPGTGLRWPPRRSPTCTRAIDARASTNTHLPQVAPSQDTPSAPTACTARTCPVTMHETLRAGSGWCVLSTQSTRAGSLDAAGTACCGYPEGLWGARLTGGSVTPARSLNNLSARRCYACRRRKPKRASRASQLLGYRPVVSWDGKVRLEMLVPSETSAGMERPATAPKPPPLREPPRRSTLEVAPSPPQGARICYRVEPPPIMRTPPQAGPLPRLVAVPI